jgi:outer membrane protein TolC
MRQVAADNLENAKTRKNDAESAFRAGASAKFDVISAERDLAEAESQSVSARTAEALALSGLNRAMGMDPMAVIVMPASLPNSTGDSLPKANPTDGLSENVESPFRYDADFDSALERSLKNRPEVHQAEAMVEAGRRGIEVAQRTIKPGLSVGYSYTYQPNAGLFTLEKVGAFSVSLNIPLYDGGVAKAKVSQAKADRDQAKLQLDEMKDVLSLQQSEQRQRFAQAGLEQAKEAFRLARQRYQVGASTQVDVSSAQAALALANANVIQANIDRQMALAMYDHALGRSFTTP